jgi:hypothetical protein
VAQEVGGREPAFGAELTPELRVRVIWRQGASLSRWGNLVTVKLHLGAFTSVVDGWVNIDVTPHLWIARFPFCSVHLTISGVVVADGADDADDDQSQLSELVDRNRSPLFCRKLRVR